MWNGKEILSEEELKKAYAEFYDYPTANPELERIEKMKAGPIDPSNALPIEGINELLKPEYLEEEHGWCVMPNGTAYVAAHCIMPNVTTEMLQWWFAWHGLDDLRYRIWWPDSHYGIYIKEEEQKIIKDPNRKLNEKYEDITHYVVEDIGTGCMELKIAFQKPVNLGFDMSRYKKPNVSAVIGANVLIYEPGKSMGKPSGCNVMCHFVRELEEGIELRTRFWFGYQMIDKKPVKILPDGIVMDAFIPQGLGIHAVEEYTRLSQLLPVVYEKLGQEPF